MTTEQKPDTCCPDCGRPKAEAITNMAPDTCRKHLPWNDPNVQGSAFRGCAAHAATVKQSDAVEALFAEIEEADRRRAELMPTERDAINALFEAYLRLKELGWNDAIYCPKDGSTFQSISAGSTGIGNTCYQGEWPKGHWWTYEAGDMWPAHPILFKAQGTKS